MANDAIRTSSGKEVSGQVVRDTRTRMSLAESLVHLATGTLAEPASHGSTTVKDTNGSYWTGRRK